MISFTLAPASRFSKTVATGMRVPRKTQAPLTFPGMLSTAAHCDQSSAIAALPVSYRRHFSPTTAHQTSCFASTAQADWSDSLRRVVRRFSRDHSLVDMAFAQASAADADEASFLQKFGQSGAAAVAHAGFQAAYHLVQDHRNRAAVRHTRLDAFRHQLRQAVGINAHVWDGD